MTSGVEPGTTHTITTHGVNAAVDAASIWHNGGFMGHLLCRVRPPSELLVQPDGILSESPEQKKVRQEKWSLLKRQGRAVKQIPSSSTGSLFWDSLGYGNSYVLAYFSKNPETNLNGVLKRAPTDKQPPIYCRHLAHAHATGVIGVRKEAGGNKYDAVLTAPYEGILTDDDLNRIHYRHCFREAHYFKLKHLTTALNYIADDVWQQGSDTRKSYLLIGTKHAMAVHVEKKRGRLILYFYDPNDSLRHKKFVMSHPAEINALGLKDFLSLSRQKNYFGETMQETVTCLRSADTAEQRDRCDVHEYGEIDNHFHQLFNGHYGHGSLSRDFHAMSLHGVPGLFAALAYGQGAATQDYMSDHFRNVAQSGRSIAELLAQAVDHKCVNGLCLAIYRGHVDAVKAYVQGVLGSDLDHMTKCQLLRLGSDKEHDGVLHFYRCWRPDASAFEAYCSMVEHSTLDEAVKSVLTLPA